MLVFEEPAKEQGKGRSFPAAKRQCMCYQPTLAGFPFKIKDGNHACDLWGYLNLNTTFELTDKSTSFMSVELARFLSTSESSF